MELEQAYLAAKDLANCGTRKPSIKLAVWAGILSANNDLARNGRQVRLLARYATKHASEKQLRATLASEPYFSAATTRYLLATQGLYEQQRLAPYLKQPSDWDTWRDTLVTLCPGVGYKVASFIALILWPLDCPFAVVERHVIKRLGILNGKGHAPNGLLKGRYHAVEATIRNEAAQAGCTYPLGIWHWFTWELQRNPQATTCETHSDLACTWY